MSKYVCIIVYKQAESYLKVLLKLGNNLWFKLNVTFSAALPTFHFYCECVVALRFCVPYHFKVITVCFSGQPIYPMGESIGMIQNEITFKL